MCGWNIVWTDQCENKKGFKTSFCWKVSAPEDIGYWRRQIEFRRLVLPEIRINCFALNFIMCVVLLTRTCIINSLYHDNVCGSPPRIHDELKEINSCRMRIHCAKQSCMLYWYCMYRAQCTRWPFIIIGNIQQFYIEPLSWNEFQHFSKHISYL